MMLLLAMIRALNSTLLRSWYQGNSGTMKNPPNKPIAPKASNTRHIRGWQQ